MVTPSPTVRDRSTLLSLACLHMRALSPYPMNSVAWEVATKMKRWRSSLSPPRPVHYILLGKSSTCYSTLQRVPPRVLGDAHDPSYRPIDPNAYGDPYERPMSTISTASSGVESSWRRRQTIKRGVTRKVKLTKGNFIAEYPVPSPVYSAIEPKWLGMSKSTEFSWVPLC